MPQDLSRLLVRACTEADLGAVLALQRTWAAESITYGLVPSAEADLAAQLGSYCLLAEQEGQVIGYATGSVHRSEGLAVIPAGVAYLEIEEVYVRPDSRRLGIGSALIERLLGTARAAGVERFLLSSATRDLDAVLAFYRRHGFRSWSVQMFR
jgi:GNAT superfamily N-acetyltransferase